MRLYGTLTELSSLTIRLTSGKNLKIKTDTQSASATDVEVNIPDVGGAAAPAFLMVDTVTPQPITGKTINFTQNTVTDGTLNISKLTAPSGLGDDVVKLNQATGVIESGKIKNANIAADAAIADTKLATISTAGKVETGAVTAVAGLPGRVLTFSDAGVSSVAKIVNANVADNADISGSKLLDNSVGVAKITTADTTGTGSLVRASSPTITTPSIDQINAPSQTLTVSGTGALRLPLGTEANRPAGTAATLKGMIRYNDEADAFEGYNELSGWSSLGGGGTTDRVTQASHGFVVGEVLYLNGSTYAKALATAANTAEVVGVVSRVIDASTFELTLSGEISGLSGLTPGEVYFLSAATAGALTVTEPSVVGQVSLPVGVASSASTLYVAPKRGVVVGAANARTTIAVSNNAATNVVSVVDYNSLKLEGELNVTRSSGGNQRAYYTVEAAKNGAGVWQVSASYTGDDVLYTTLPSWDVASNNLQVTMPLVTNFSSASLTYSLNAPAVGASLPLSVDSTALNIVADAPLSYRNRIINGDMRIDQRNAGASVTNTSSALFPVDRFSIEGIASSKFSGQQSAVAPSGFSNSLLITSLAATALGASDYYLLRQKIEGFNVADLGWGTASAQTVTFSFWVRSSLTGTFGGALQNADQSRAYPFSYTINAVNTWEQKTVTVAGDTTGTWNSTNGTGVMLTFSLGVGASKSATAGSWTAGQFWSATGATSVVGTNGATLYLTGVQLEVGSKASAFERRPIQQEIAMCQRYFEKSYDINIAPGTASVLLGQFYHLGSSDSSGSVGPYIQFRVTKRSAPIFTAYTDPGLAGSWGYARNGAAGVAVVTTMFVGQSGGLVYLNCGANWVPASVNGHWTASAEL